MINELLVNLVDSVLGGGKRTARGNKAYTCPHCNHSKPKLEVNFSQEKIIFTFDEKIVVDNFYSSFFISPPLTNGC